MSVLFEHGVFTDAAASAQVFGILILSAPLNYLIVLIVRLLLIARAARAQSILALGIAGLNAGLNIALAPIFGLAGIALSTLFSRALILLLSYAFLLRYLPQIGIRLSRAALVRTAVSAVAMVSVVILLQSQFSFALSRSDGIAVQIAVLSTLIGVGAAVYLLVAFLIRHPDLFSLLSMIKPSTWLAEA